MIQRVQSLYLTIVFILNAVIFNLLPASDFIFDNILGDNTYMIVSILFYASALLALISIFKYKNRQLQFVLGRLNMLLNAVLVGIFVYGSLNLPGESSFSEKGIGVLLPIISIVFIVIANKAIKKDEDLVKSVDRFR
ncbi:MULTISPECIES: DUF4293 domain-containing protein [Psychroflexus]|uniref:Transcription termination factor Rho n=1 Tax=Psychroflexus halocasei TaxID=908615 RepID=A0A1H3ZMM1_9FLAO|nr:MULTISPECIES: DUF4293 domain-containing protein [Psychroflexus]PJX20058.1 hypothetical protein CAP47_12175 [Psychroflexus sp. S27]SEA24462.1 protein of unknown function [Psychroflexus halocasei]